MNTQEKDIAMDRLRGLSNKRQELMQQLDLSLSIEKLWPEAFATEGQTQSRIDDDRTYPLQSRFVIIRSDGEERSFTIRQVLEVNPKLLGQQLKNRGTGTGSLAVHIVKYYKIPLSDMLDG